MIALNDVSGGKVFGQDNNKVTIFVKNRDNKQDAINKYDYPDKSKLEIARDLVTLLAEHINQNNLKNLKSQQPESLYDAAE